MHNMCLVSRASASIAHVGKIRIARQTTIRSEKLIRSPITSLISERNMLIRGRGQRARPSVQDLPYSGYFSGGIIFVFFVVEGRATKYLPKEKTASHNETTPQ